jgi:hypothetical protein
VATAPGVAGLGLASLENPLLYSTHCEDASQNGKKTAGVAAQGFPKRIVFRSEEGGSDD